jgi:hypothetical protein
MRRQRLMIDELPDEVLVYDLDRHKAHCLNQTAALVWKHCDGRTSVSQIAEQLAKELGAPVDEKLVWFALDQLGRDHLLAEGVVPPPTMKGMTRRQMVRALGLAAVVAVPLITSIVAPIPVATASCGGNGAPCSTVANCCPGCTACVGSLCVCL